MKNPFYNSIFITLSLLGIIYSLSLTSRPFDSSKPMDQNKIVLDKSDFFNAKLWFKRKYQIDFKLNEKRKVEIFKDNDFRYLFKRVPFLKALESQEVLHSYQGFNVFLSPLSNEQEEKKSVAICVPEKQLKTAKIILTKHDLPFKASADPESIIGLSIQARQEELQQELTTLVTKINDIKDARVTLYPSIKPMIASILVATNSQQSLSSKKKQGIKALVAGTIPGLQPKNILILNRDRQRSLKNNIKTLRKHIKIQHMMETDLENEIRETLEKKMGRGQVKVNLDARFETIDDIQSIRSKAIFIEYQIPSKIAQDNELTLELYLRSLINYDPTKDTLVLRHQIFNQSLKEYLLKMIKCH